MTTLTGRCLCGSSTYVAESEPLITAICHCTSCQRQTGTAYSLVVGVPRDAFRLEGEHVSTFVTTSEESGNPAERKFCAACGSPLATLAEDLPQLALIKAGTLDDRAVLEPGVEVHCSSALPFAVREQVERARFPAGLPAE